MRRERFFDAFAAVAIAILAGACSKSEPAAPAVEAREARTSGDGAEAPPAALQAQGEGRTDAPPVVSECPASDTRPTVMIRDCDTGVPNVAVGKCTVADQFPACLDGPADDIQRCMAKVSNRLMEMGVLDGPAKGSIQRCAASEGTETE